MSFYVSFSARSVNHARAVLAKQQAPLLVKALIEHALDAVKPSTPIPGSPAFVGVQVIASGHISIGCPYQPSRIERFEVTPLYETPV